MCDYEYIINQNCYPFRIRAPRKVIPVELDFIRPIVDVGTDFLA